MNDTGAAAPVLPVCEQWLPVLRPHLPLELVGDAELGRLARSWSLWSPSWLTALEVRLAAGSCQVDTAVRLPSPGAARGLAERLRSPRLRRFLEQWGRRAPVGYPEPVPSLWLELDLGAGPAPAPLLCARLHPGVGSTHLSDVVLPALTGERPSPRRRRLVARLVDELPSGAHLLYVFDLAARRDGVIRLELFETGIEAVLPYLRKVAPSDVVDRCGRCLPLVAGADRYHLSLDLGEEILPRVGIECGWRRPPRSEPGWGRLLDRLVDAGHCAAPKRGGVLSWPGQDSLRTAPTGWPEAAVAAGGFLVRALSHVKLVSDPGRELEAKGYLLFQHLTGRRPGRRARPAGYAEGGEVPAGASSPSSAANAPDRSA